MYAIRSYYARQRPPRASARAPPRWHGCRPRPAPALQHREAPDRDEARRATAQRQRQVADPAVGRDDHVEAAPGEIPLDRLREVRVAVDVLDLARERHLVDAAVVDRHLVAARLELLRNNFV